LGAKNVVITDGDNGSFVQDENNRFYYLGSVKIEVVEKTGAGDAYTSGFLAAVLNGKPVEEAMRWGAQDSASVIQQIGAEAGLLTKTALEATGN
jgi:sugar/nucleoside kinase (ribokinase family)